MTSVNIANNLINHIIKESKDILHDTYINKEKVPSYTNIKSNLDYQEIMLHGGIKSQNIRKFGYFRLKRDQLPIKVQKDSFSAKTTKIMNDVKMIRNSSTKNSAKKNKTYYKSNTKSNNSIKSIGFNTVLKFGKQTSQQPTLIKLQPQQLFNNLNQQSQLSIRVKNKQQQLQNQLRYKKQIKSLHKNKELDQNKHFQDTKINRQIQKKKMIEQHINKGQSYKFNFDDQGQIILYCTSNKKISKLYPKETPYTIQQYYNQNQQPSQGNHKQLKFQRNRSYNKKYNNYTPSNDNQRIQSARGLAFVSSVLKTMNLSKISLNQTYQEFQPQHFMKRNDLFNNNHSRQTSNIPYFQPKSGTVYTEISTNQVIGSKPLSTAKTNFPSQYQQKTFNKLSKKFQSFLKNGDINCKTSQAEYECKQTQQRPVKTAGHNGRKTPLTQRRPHSSTNKGRIVTANSNLIIDLLK